MQQPEYDVEKICESSQEISDATNVSPGQKIDLLSQWELDLKELLIATEENLTGAKPG